MNAVGIETALTFHGKISQIPEVIIDSCQPFHISNAEYNNTKVKPQYCFISHAHSDHYKGLSTTFPSYVENPLFIMTKTTHSLIISSNASSSSSALRRNLSRCLFPKVNETYQLETGLEFTLIPNFHCLGSCMVLLKDMRRGNTTITILYTGDARFEDSVLSSFKTNHKLLPFIYGDEQLDMVFLDTTFAYRKKNIDILENSHGIYQLIRLIEMYPLGTTFNFLDTVYGFEEVWVKLLAYFADRMVLTFGDKVRKWMSNLENIKGNDFASLLEKRVNSMDDITAIFKSKYKDEYIHMKDKYNFHIGRNKNLQMFNSAPVVEVKHAIDLTKTEYLSIHSPKTEDEFYDLIYKKEPVEKWIGKFTYKDTPLVFEYMQDENKKMYLPLHIKFIYSRHSSYTETKKFIDLFKLKPKDLYPMTESFNTWQRGFNMLRFYDVPNTTYDRESLQNYGSCNINTKNDERNIQAVDFWCSTFEEDQFIQSFNSVSTDVDFDFDAMGQDLRQAGEHRSFDQRKDALVMNDGRKVRRQIEEKNRRIDRFLQNVDTEAGERYNAPNVGEKVSLQVMRIVTAKIEKAETSSNKRQRANPVDETMESLLTGIKF